MREVHANVPNELYLRSDLAKEGNNFSCPNDPKPIMKLELIFGIEYWTGFAVYPFVNAEKFWIDRKCFGTLKRHRLISSYDNRC